MSLLLGAFYPAAAAEDKLRVLAVHTASAPRVSMVVELSPTLRDWAVTSDELSVTVDDEPVAATVTPLASSRLSVALVIDTGSNVTAEELRAVQSGATEFLLRLPQDAHTLVVDAGQDPEVVAALSPGTSEALSAVSAMRTGGSSSAAAGVLLAARASQAAPPGPRVIIVYAPGLDEHGVLAERLSQAVLQAEAVLNVILTGADPFWELVVDRTGGTVVRTGASQVVRSYADLAAALGNQYFLAFKAPGELPTVAEVVLRAGKQQHRSVIVLPHGSTTVDAEGRPSELSPAGSRLGPILLIFVAISLTALGVFVYVRHTRQAAAWASTEPSAEMTGSAASAPLADPARSTAPAAAPATAHTQRASPRGSLSAAVQGRRLAQQAVRADSELGSPRHLPNEPKHQYEANDVQASSAHNHSTSAAVRNAETPKARKTYGHGHGNTPAAWTAAIVVLVGFFLGAIAVVVQNWLLFWIGGVGLVVVGGITGKVMQIMGLGKPLPSEQEESGVPTTADRTDQKSA
ncbi:MAG: VWA domain-containing protein [Jiangellaceae bacterium]|nr:VWA domain-containing protein [Jiangellaceae bacterium]